MTPLRNADVATARDAWLTALRRAGGLQLLPTETIDLATAVGRVTAAGVVARRSAPAFDAAAMDGIAVAASSTAGSPVTLDAAAFHLVDTGDALPPGTDAVVRREDVVLTTGATVEHESVSYANVRQVGEDVAAGDLLFEAGRRLGPADLAVAASAGETTILARQRPAVAILPSGDELVPVGGELAPGQFVDTNSLMLGAMVEQAGGVAIRAPIVPDDPELLAAALERAAGEADLVLLVAGSARGAGDHTVAVMQRVGQVVVQGAAVRPGHPVVLGLVGSTPVIGIPGYPVSAALAFELFAAPLLARLAGGRPPERTRARARAGDEIRSTPRSDEWVRVRVGRIGEDLVALPLRRGAGVLSSLARADGLVLVPVGVAGVAPGDEIEIELLQPLEAVEAALLVTGSTDPLLDLLAAGRRDDSTRGPGFDLRADADGSVNGAVALAAGRCHLALVVADDLPAGAVALAAWERQVGLITAAGGPHEIAGIEDLRSPGVRISNRQPGSAMRGLLDTLLAEHSIDPRTLAGYGREARSHAAAAAAVAAGAADCALGVLSASASQHLRFVPLATQKLVLAASASLAEDERIATLRSWLASPECSDEIELHGYRTLDP